MSGIMAMVLGAKTAIAAAVDEFFNRVTLLLPGNGTNGAQNNTFLDSSTNNFTITRNGNTTQGTFSPFSQTGWGNYFDGSGDYLTAADNAAFDLGSGDWTIELFVNFNSVSGEKGLVSHFTAGTPNAGYTLRLSTGNSPSGLRLVCSGSTDVVLQAAWTPVVGTWYHIAAVRDSGTLRIYVNGTQIGSTSIAITIGNPSTTFAVGTAQTVASSDMDGYLSNVRLVKGTCLYPSGTTFTAPTSALTAVTNTSLLTCQSNRFVDNSSNAFAITVNGTPSVQAFSPFAPTAAYSAATNGGSGYFDGAGDYLTIADNAAFTMGTGDFTIEYWTYVPTLADMRSYGQCDSTPNVNTISFFGGINGSSKGYCGVRSGTTEYACTSTANFPRNQWVHHALVRDGTTLRQYINGVQDGTSSVGSASVNDSSFQLAIGRLGEFNAYNWNGYISSFRITKGGCLYPSGTTFTPPTAPFTTTVSSGTVSLLTNFTNAGITDATAKNALETVGNAQISTTQSKFGGSSMSFNGNSGTYLIVDAPTTNLFAFGTGDFTVEMWAYFNSLATDQTLFDTRPTSTNGLYPAFYTSGSSSINYFVNSTNVITGTFALSTATWYHVALSRSGTSTKLFINGTQVGSTYTDSNNYLCGTARPMIGNNGSNTSNPLNGYIDDLRITKGYARYTASFTPPTAAFATQ